MARYNFLPRTVQGKTQYKGNQTITLVFQYVHIIIQPLQGPVTLCVAKVQCFFISFTSLSNINVLESLLNPCNERHVRRCFSFQRQNLMSNTVRGLHPVLLYSLCTSMFILDVANTTKFLLLC